ncbi:hypothetical protein FB45DRAFT_894144 [Roridomyces roridus]|uniref:Uncharacterized protein n=1 Tax=Roridomyces roridus TaxID=1738132 RepID=A0AAD7CG05_9AGAR|nr:hypothetical protein FB45DRAFT_894144 [Roridomyces roridus]
MAFFAGATNFTVQGGTFNTISGDLNEHHQHYSVYTVNSNNNYNDDEYRQHYNPPRGPQPPRGYPPPGVSRGPPPRHRPRHHHQEYASYGRGLYYNNTEANWGDRSDLEAAMDAPGHVEIVEGEFLSHSGRSHSRNSTQDRQASSPSPAAMDPISSDVPDQGITTSTVVNGVVVEEEEDDEDMPPVDADVAASTPSPAPAGQPSRSHLDSLRMNMAGLNIEGDAGVQEVRATDKTPSAERKRGNPFSTFGRKFAKS